MDCRPAGCTQLKWLLCLYEDWHQICILYMRERERERERERGGGGGRGESDRTKRREELLRVDLSGTKEEDKSLNGLTFLYCPQNL